MNNQTEEKKSLTKSELYDKHYKTILTIPVIIMVLSLAYLAYFYSQNGDIMLKDISLSGGSTITIQGDIDSNAIESAIKSQFPDLSIRKLTDIGTGKSLALILETSAQPDEIKPALEKYLGYKLTDENSSFEFTGPSLSESFYKQLLIALLISFILMSIVVFFSFKTFIPSLAVIFAAFSDIVMPLALIDFLGIKISAAGISAFLMLIGYSVDTDILLTSRALRKKGGNLNQRIFGAFKTGSFMTLTALIAVLPAFFIISGLPDSFRQIFFILALGLFADLINTWLTNASIIKWYCVKRRIE
ncbi:protein translocase subunit SecF [Candidatus Pacearchaeota archaeon]|nr:protein translocase subunit SecF [Candidatus Pacearchaeota archaeon]